MHRILYVILGIGAVVCLLALFGFLWLFVVR